MTSTPTPTPTSTSLASSPVPQTSTGEIIDPSAAPAPAPAPAPTIPESYSDFTLPEGYTIDPDLIQQATALFKESKLPQDAAQKLVDLYTKQTSGLRDELLKSVERTRTEWRDAVKSDTTIGARLESHILPEIARAKDKLPAEVRTAFNEAMDFTGAGDHPAVVRALYELSKLVNEGTHVTGSGPSPAGQTRSGQPSRPSTAAAIYPHLSQ